MELIERYIQTCQHIENRCGYTDHAAQKKMYEAIASVEPDEKLKLLYDEKAELLGLKIGFEHSKNKLPEITVGQGSLVAEIDGREVNVYSLMFMNPATGNKGAAPVKNVAKLYLK